MITKPEDFRDIILKHSEEDTKEVAGTTMVSYRCIADFGGHSPMMQLCDALFREFQETSEMARMKERLLDLELKVFEMEKQNGKA